MSGGKETPRQKMIGMMYLVLTAMLALNVSREILNAFSVVDNSMVQTIENIDSKLGRSYSELSNKATIDPAGATEWYNQALKAKEYSDTLVAYLDKIKGQIIVKFDGKNPYFWDEELDAPNMDSVKGLPVSKLKNKDIYSGPTDFFLGNDEVSIKKASLLIGNTISSEVPF